MYNHSIIYRKNSNPTFNPIINGTQDSSETQLCTNDIIPNGMKSCIYSPRLSAPRAAIKLKQRK